MSRYTLGIDTSNYATSLAVFDTAGEVVCAKKRFLPVKEGQLGLRQSDALFHHTTALPEMLEELSREFDLTQIAAVGVSQKPRPVEGSYMPCFLAGVSAATAFARARGIPLVHTTHQQGHAAAALFAAKGEELFRQKVLLFHISGGTTDLLLCDEVRQITTLGTSSDLYAGQAVDRVGVKLGFPFPAGAEVSRLAALCEESIRPKSSVKGMTCSLSGLENQCNALLQAGKSPEYVCKYCLLCVADTVVRMTKAAQKEYPGLPVVCAGGVMSSDIIRVWVPAAGVFRAGPVFQRQRHRCVHPCRTGGRIMAEVISVSALNQYVKTLLDANDLLFDLALRGEIANFVQNARSGHCYFSLRDETSSVKAVMFRSDARRLGFRPEEGMKVIVRCRATLYERDGAFQVYVNDMFPDGIGSAQLAFEQLKAKLDREGLFAAERKKPLPRFPKCIGLVTSKTGAALQDIRNVIGRRWPAVRLLLCPVSVQGFEAADEIAAAIDRLDKSGQVDEIIVARGGGSREDLWVFNAERIARAASRCKTPLISAIGHEIDFTILDFVADQRAPTPSAAAELAVPDRAEFSRKLCNLEENIHISIQNRLSLCYNRLDETVQPLSRQNMQAQLAGRQQQLEAVSGQLQTAAQKKQQDAGLRLRHAAALAATLNSYGVLARGYALVQDEKGRICAPDALREGQKMTLCGAVNRIHCTVDAVEGPNESTQEL